MINNKIGLVRFPVFRVKKGKKISDGSIKVPQQFSKVPVLVSSPLGTERGDLSIVRGFEALTRGIIMGTVGLYKKTFPKSSQIEGLTKVDFKRIFGKNLLTISCENPPELLVIEPALPSVLDPLPEVIRNEFMSGMEVILERINIDLIRENALMARSGHNMLILSSHEIESYELQLPNQLAFRYASYNKDYQNYRYYYMTKAWVDLKPGLYVREADVDYVNVRIIPFEINAKPRLMRIYFDPLLELKTRDYFPVLYEPFFSRALVRKDIRG